MYNGHDLRAYEFELVQHTENRKQDVDREGPGGVLPIHEYVNHVPPAAEEEG